MTARVVIVLVLLATLAVPFALKPKQTSAVKADDTLVIITPHNEAIRSEFTRAFRTWYRAQTGRTVALDWRNIGGTSEIARFLESEYTAAFRNLWENKLRQPWSTEVQAGFQAARLAADAPEQVKRARAEFLQSEASCGIDIFFGGGSYDLDKQAGAGRIVASGLRAKHPEWFTEAVVPRRFAGEDYRDEQGRWLGSVISVYGIVFNRHAVKRLGVAHEPEQWSDLADPRYLGEVALCDPTKSGSMTKAFENVVQQQMQQRLVRLRAERPQAEAKGLEAEAVRDGWADGLRLLQLVGANARYYTDTSQKVPIDVADGNCAAGMCIDFYGRQQIEALARRGESERMGFVSPVGGNVGAVDPIALLRGAPHRAVAERFIEFVMSMDGQKIWNLKTGTPGGPERFALRRLPVRRDFYALKELEPLRSDPEANPFSDAGTLVYRPEWTGGLFRELGFVTRVMCQDTHEELVAAWRAINAASGERRVRALAVLQAVDAVSYEQAQTTIKQALASRDKTDELRLAKALAEKFRANYAKAERIARGE